MHKLFGIINYARYFNSGISYSNEWRKHMIGDRLTVEYDDSKFVNLWMLCNTNNYAGRDFRRVSNNWENLIRQRHSLPNANRNSLKMGSWLVTAFLKDGPNSKAADHRMQVAHRSLAGLLADMSLPRVGGTWKRENHRPHLILIPRRPVSSVRSEF